MGSKYFDKISVVHWFPELETHKCGYCKQLNTNCSYGMWAENLTVEDYQCLLDRGWRRSGKYIYKPQLDITCCPLYTISCKAVDFQISKSQKKTIRRLNRFLSDSTIQHETVECASTPADFENVLERKSVKNFDPNRIVYTKLYESINQQSEQSASENNASEIDIIDHQTENRTSEENNDEIAKCSLKKSVSSLEKTAELINRLNKNLNKVTNNVIKEKDGQEITSTANCEIKSGIGADPTKPPCKKAKLIRLEYKKRKLEAQGRSLSLKTVDSRNRMKSLEDFIEDVGTNPRHILKVYLVLTSGFNNDWSQIISEEYQIYQKYQMSIHGDSSEKCNPNQFKNFLLESPLKICLKKMTSLDPTFDESAKLYQKYQLFVHQDIPSTCDPKTFQEFLIASPLEPLNIPGGPSHGYGSFHQQYWLDDKLIAVGVIDILPKCVSSVYFFYDPEYRHLALGTYGSLREVYLVRQLHNKVPDLKYYYMGYYIHMCPKMRYKANLKPSFLLCPETFTWFPIEHCLRKLEKNKYSRFNDDLEALDKDIRDIDQALDELKFLVGYRNIARYRCFRAKFQRSGEHDHYLHLAKLVGKKCLRQLFVIIQDDC